MTDISLRKKTVGTLKWNTIDRIATQVLYAATGVVLANILTQEEFGVVGVLLVFQAFATILTDSGFGAALLQKKKPTEEDYSTLFWFNLAVSVAIYLVLFLCAPFIADLFHEDGSLVDLSRVMFLAFVFNGLSIVQVNRMMKSMDVRQLALSNMFSLTLSGGLGIGLALGGFGAWALVWQTVALNALKTIWLWMASHWRPRYGFHIDSLKSIYRVGMSVLATSALNTLCLHFYTLAIAAFYNFKDTGIYTQADKWSKMGSASLSQILTSSFLPVLAGYQDDSVRFKAYVHKVSRLCGFIVFPVLMGMAAVGEPLFHTLFGNKWDAAIPLFQLLALRGVFVVLTSLYTNYILALGYAKSLVKAEIVKDVVMAAALVATIFSGSLMIIVAGQLVASVLTCAFSLYLASRVCAINKRSMISDLLPYALISAAMGVVSVVVAEVIPIPMLSLIGSMAAGVIIYLLFAKTFRLPELAEAMTLLKKKKI